MTDVVIIGGGVAGLATANALAEQGIYATIIEGGSYPSNKVCGEFFSSECMPILEAWDLLPATPVSSIKLVVGEHAIRLPIELAARSCSRWEFDHRLADRAVKLGAKLITETLVDDLDVPVDHRNPYRLKLSTGETLSAEHIVIGAGRLVAKLQRARGMRARYFGFKGHLTGLYLEDALEMHLVKGGYVGLASIGDGKTNVAGLIDLRSSSPSVDHILATNPSLGEIISAGNLAFPEWMQVRAPAFGVRHAPNWPRAYFVGDAAGTLPPATGSGLAMGLTSGVMAAEFLARNDPGGFRQTWNKRYGTAFRWGRVLHGLFMSRAVSSSLPLLASVPMLSHFLHRTTRVAR